MRALFRPGIIGEKTMSASVLKLEIMYSFWNDCLKFSCWKIWRPWGGAAGGSKSHSRSWLRGAAPRWHCGALGPIWDVPCVRETGINWCFLGCNQWGKRMWLEAMDDVGTSICIHLEIASNLRSMIYWSILNSAYMKRAHCCMDKS